MYKTPQLRNTFRSCHVEKVHTFRSQNVKITTCSDHFWKLRCRKKVHTVVARSTFRSRKCKKLWGTERFWTFRCRFALQAQGIMHLVKVSKTSGICSISKNDGRRGTFEGDLQRYIFRGRRSTRDMFIRDVKRSGR